MNDTRDKLEQLLETAGSDEDRRAMTELWHDLGRLTIEDPPEAMPERFARRLRATTLPGTQRKFHWQQMAASLCFGLALGAILAAAAIRSGPTVPPVGFRGAAVTAVQPNRTASQRLASLHTIGGLASVEPEFRAELVARALRDSTPAIQLAAIDHLARLDLSPAEAERLARALPEVASPIAQFTLLDLLGSRTEPKVLESIEALARDPSVESLVRRHAEMQLESLRKDTHA